MKDKIQAHKGRIQKERISMEAVSKELACEIEIHSEDSMESGMKSGKVKLPEMIFGYFIGPFGALLSMGIFSSFLNKYFTDVLQLNPGFLSALQLVSTIFIVAANFVVGQLIERTKLMTGKARPWILLSALTLSVSSVLMFTVPFEGRAKLIYIAISYNLYYAVAYPIYNTANSMLISLSTRNGKDRGMLASVNNVAGLGVMGTGSMVFPILVSNVLKENQSSWLIAMTAIAIFSALTICLQYRFTRERVTEEKRGIADTTEKEKQERTVSLREQLRAVTSEKWWWIIMIFYLLFQWSGAMKNGSMSYFCQWVIGNSGFAGDYGVSQSLLAVAGAIPMAAAAVFVVPLANKFGKRNVTFAGMVIGATGGILAGLGNENLVPVAIGVALKCLGSAPAGYLILAMLADVIEHVEYRHGIRTDGLTMSLYSSIMVAATPICNAVFMEMLNLSGYMAPTADMVTQTESVRCTISIGYIWTETIAYVICAILILFWNAEIGLKEEKKES